MALILTGAAIFVTSDLPDLLLSKLQSGIPATPSTAGGKLELLIEHPAPLILLAAGCFYLWVYIRYQAPIGITTREDAPMDVAASAG